MIQGSAFSICWWFLGRATIFAFWRFINYQDTDCWILHSPLYFIRPYFVALQTQSSKDWGSHLWWQKRQRDRQTSLHNKVPQGRDYQSFKAGVASQCHHTCQVIAGMTDIIPFIFVLRFNLEKSFPHDQWQYGVVLGGISSRLVRAGTSVGCSGT